MAYTSAQQAQIDSAKAKLDSANTTLQNAISAYNSAYGTFCGGYWNSLTDCDIRDAQSRVPTWKKVVWSAGMPIVGILGALGVIKGWKRTPYVKPTSCADALSKGSIETWKCKHGKGDCKKQDTCDGRIADYNTHINAVYSGNANVDGAKQAYDQAKINYDTVLKGIGEEVKNDPAVIHAGQQIDADAKVRGQRYIFYGILLLVGAGLIALFIRGGKKVATT